MKKLVIFLLIFISCSENSKPDNLMSENQMVDFLFDINIINSSRAFRNISDLNYYNIKDTFLYKLHNIDSLQFVNSNKYYSCYNFSHLCFVTKIRGWRFRSRCFTRQFHVSKISREFLNKIYFNNCCFIYYL